MARGLRGFFVSGVGYVRGVLFNVVLSLGIKYEGG